MTDNKSTVYFHIGSPKTGTSSIQAFMTKYNRQLREEGLLYPIMGRSHLGIDGVSKVFINGSGYRTPNLAQYHAKILNSVKQMNMPATLISDESLFVEYRNFVAAFKQHVPNPDVNFKVIVYLKNSFQYLCDLWKESVRGEPMLQQTLENYLEYYNYESNLEAIHELGALFGNENIIVRTFEPDTWKNNNIIEDIMDQMGVAPSAAESKETNLRSNKGALRKHTERNRYLNAYFSNLSANQRLRIANIRYGAVAPVKDDIAVAKSVPKDLVMAVCDKYRPIEDSIAQTFLGRDQLFQSPYPNMDDNVEDYDPSLTSEEQRELREIAKLICEVITIEQSKP